MYRPPPPSSLHLPGTATSTLHTDTLDFIPSHVYKTPVDQHTVAYVNLGMSVVPLQVHYKAVGSGAFLTLDPEGVFPDPGSQPQIFDSLMTKFWVKSTIILSVLAKKISLPVQK